MAVFKQEEILGCWVSQKLICIDCVEEQEDITQENILTVDEAEKSENLYFCDSCSKKIG